MIVDLLFQKMDILGQDIQLLNGILKLMEVEM
jgi:hypothetical protein